MNKITSLFVFIVIIGTCVAAKYAVNGVPVLINQYKYDIPTYHTPLKAKYDLPYLYPYPYLPEVPQIIEDLPEVIEIVVPKAPPKPHVIYGVPDVDTIISEDAPVKGVPEENAAPAEEVKEEPITASYKYEVPSIPEPVPELGCGDDILIPAEPAPKEPERKEPIITSYQFEIPPTSATPKPGKPALVYGVPDVIIAEEEPASPAPGKPALVYGVPEVVIAKEEPVPPASGKPALIYGIPENLPIVEDN